MKKNKLLFILLIILLATGCVKYDLSMSVKTDKSMTLVLIDAFEKEYASYLEGDATSKDEYIALGYQVEDYEEENYQGLKLTKKFDSIDNISSPNCGTVELTELLEKKVDEIILFKSSKEGTVTTYTATFTYDLTEDDTDNSESVDYSTYASSMIFKYSITIPSNATIISNNADTTSNNNHTLNWNLEYGKKKNINFVFSIDDNNVTEEVLDEEEKTETPKEDDNVHVTGKDEVKENNGENNNNTFRYIVTGLIAAVIILGALAFKIKMSTRTKKNNTNSQLNHSTPPDNRNV